MNFTTWRIWLTSLPWSRRWFVLLVLLRPLIDAFYQMKNVSPFLSPLYVAGVMTPVIAGGCWMTGALPTRSITKLDLVMAAYTGMLAINALAVLTLDVSLNAIELILKLTMPSVVYFFVRHLIRSHTDLLGVITTFLYGCVVPFGTLVFEHVVAPISVQNARGMVRYEGLYSDVVTYSIYAMLTFVCLGYLFVLYGSARRLPRHLAVVFAIGFGLCGLCLLSIHHATSWGVGAAIAVMIALFSTRLGTFVGPVMIGLIGLTVFWLVGDKIGHDLTTVYGTEVQIVQGNQDSDRAFHGRMVTWKKYFQEWDDFSSVGKLLGVATTGRRDIMRPMMLRGIHNDYLRIMFSSGILGLICFLWVLVITFFTSWKLPLPERFLSQTIVLVASLYAVTTLPTTYPSFLYVVMSVIAYAALADELRMDEPQYVGWA